MLGVKSLRTVYLVRLRERSEELLGRCLVTVGKVQRPPGEQATFALRARLATFVVESLLLHGLRLAHQDAAMLCALLPLLAASVRLPQKEDSWKCPVAPLFRISRSNI